MTDVNLLGRSDRVLTASPDLTWVAGALIIGAITFNAALCFINTHVSPIHNSYVVGSEMLIVAIALLACHRTMDPKSVLIIGAVLLYTAFLAFLRSGINPEAGIRSQGQPRFLDSRRLSRAGQSRQ